MCPITHKDVKMLEEPVVTREGHTYEKAAIVEWLSTHGTSPMTRNPMSVADIFPQSDTNAR